MSDSTRKKLLDAALKTLIGIGDTQWYVKGPATFISEVSSRFGDIPEADKKILGEVTEEEIRQALSQLEFATSHSAETAAGVYRIEKDLKELSTAIKNFASIAQTNSVNQRASKKATMDKTSIRAALANLSESDLSTLLACLPGATKQVPFDGTVPDRVSRLLNWIESSSGPEIEEVGEVASNVLSNFPPK